MVWPFRRKDAPPASRKSSTFFLSLGGARSGLTGAGYDRLATEGYIECVVAFACINMVAAAVASVEPQIYKKNIGTGKLDKLDTHPLLDLIENPNPAQSGKEFIRHLVSYHRLAGNAYVFGNGIDPTVRKSKPPTELQLLNPGKVKIEPGAVLPKQYEYKPNPNTTTVFPVDQISGRSAVLHLKTFNPLNAWYGMSPLEAAALGVDIHNDGQKWNKRLIENGARPSGALVVTGADGKGGTLSDEQYQRVKAMIDEQYSGPANAGRPVLLEGGLDWKEMSLNPKDMEFLQGKASAARDIALAFGVPPQLLGIPGDNTYSNYSEAKLALWTDTVLPLLGIVNDGFNRWLAPLYGDDVILWYDEETIPALEPLRKQKSDRINASKTMTINEKRRAMGQDDLPAQIGDAILLDGRGILLGVDGSIVALGINQNVDSSQDPLAGNYTGVPDDPNAAQKHRAWLMKNGYTEERAERLTKLAYG
jgi:HK97 family phage portal protein